MTKTTKQTGSCLCGSVRISAINPSNKVGACHCGMCRKWGGGPFMEIDCGTEVSVRLPLAENAFLWNTDAFDWYVSEAKNQWE